MIRTVRMMVEAVFVCELFQVSFVRTIGLRFFLATLCTLPVLLKAQALDLTDFPAYIPKTPAPNLVVSFDNSASMHWGFMPDELAAGSRQKLHAAKSSYYNTLYYNPQLYYSPPLGYDGELLENADFNAASTNAFAEWVSAKGLSTAQQGNVQRIDLARAYWPRWDNSSQPRYPLNAVDSSDQERKGAAYYYVYDPDLNATACAGSEQEKQLLDACYRYVEVSEHSGPERIRPELGAVLSKDERSNFANWYQYYSLRILMAKTVLSHGFSPENLSSSVRVARQSFDQLSLHSGTEISPVQGVHVFDGSERQAFYNWLYTIEQTQGSAVRSALVTAGNYFASSGAASPYRQAPWQAGDSGEELACRENYHLLVSDGLWNAQFPAEFRGSANSDNSMRVLPDGKLYRPGKQILYGDKQSETLADLAFHYWATDLRPDLANDLPAARKVKEDEKTDSYWDHRNNPATWQHMVNYVLGFGTAGSLSVEQKTLQTIAEGKLVATRAGTQQYGWSRLDAKSDVNDPGKADDLYHAAVNSRGEFLSLDRLDLFKNRISRISSKLKSARHSATAPAINTTSLGTTGALYQAQFDAEKNTGHLLALPLGSEAGLESGVCRPTRTDSADCDALWDVADVNQDRKAQDKSIYTYNPSGSLAKRGSRFLWSSAELTPEQLGLLHASDGMGRQRVNYIRGERKDEQQYGGSLKDRHSAVLGAVINSSPLYLSNGFNANGSPQIMLPDDLEEGQSYRDFLCSTPQDNNNDGLIDSCSTGIFQRMPMIYVGSNDGLLHAYDARLAGGSDGRSGGREVFSYIPDLLIKKISLLTDPQSGHVAMLDGPLAATDVFYDNRWHTVLVGGLRSGGQGYFALNVTRPELYQNGDNASELVMWEFSDKDDADLGYSYSQPIIVKSNYTAGTGSGRWVVIFGNGYNADEADAFVGKSQAALFVVDIQSGELIRKISTGVGDSLHPNGLASPGVIYNNDDFKADYAYAGDLQGNLWKFDLSAADPALWHIAYGAHTAHQNSPLYAPLPLFSAQREGKAQAVTSAPLIAPHPAGEGFLVYFGTGKYLQDIDQQDTSIQSVYAIWDKNRCSDNGEIKSCAEIAAPLNHIHTRVTRAKLLEQKITAQSSGQRTSSEYPVRWHEHSGWFMDLDYSPGERVVVQALVRGQLVFFSTSLPAANQCSDETGGWLMAFNRVDGSTPEQQAFDVNNDGSYDEHDSLDNQLTSGVKMSEPSVGMTTLGCGDKLCLVGESLTPVNEGIAWGRWRWQMLSD